MEQTQLDYVERFCSVLKENVTRIMQHHTPEDLLRYQLGLNDDLCEDLDLACDATTRQFNEEKYRFQEQLTMVEYKALGQVLFTRVKETVEQACMSCVMGASFRDNNQADQVWLNALKRRAN